MNTLQDIHFKGTFRDYQRNILSQSRSYLKDGHIHIVAAPGSGKTTLGLELICRLGHPALILSPSVTIRQQWCQRFKDSFADENTQSDMVSSDLKSPSVITSITYQALHAAFTRSSLQSDPEDEFDTSAAEDFSEFDLMNFIRRAGIKTICLDEAHHLQNEWQKALEGFISGLDKDTKIIALTATPPYDGTPAQWNRYIGICGQIDEEIFVPQLVAQKSLCPHQDFIFFNYPTDDELEILTNHRQAAGRYAAEFFKSDLIKKAAENLLLKYKESSLEEMVLTCREEFSAFCSVMTACNYHVPESLTYLVHNGSNSVRSDMKTLQTALQLIIDKPDWFGEDIADSLKKSLAGNSLIEQKKVCLKNTEKINRMLVSSAGKLQSISSIVRTESENLGSKLRMLILTDYIRKELLSSVGTDNKFSSMGTVPVFETVRRICGENIKVAALSGSLVIIPESAKEYICALCNQMDVSLKTQPIEGTSHFTADFSGSNKNKVTIMTKAFEQGYINIMTGTKSLLGEGWDSPCINSLILASFVGSFMLSNQMRGRAIRIDKECPEKCADIWHLTTIEPADQNADYIPYEIQSSDFETLKRRFNCFLAPAYHYDMIESGMDRIDIIKPPYDEKGITSINSQTLQIAADRCQTAKRWDELLAKSIYTDIIQVNEIPVSNLPVGLYKPYIFKQIILGLIAIVISTGLAFLSLTIPAIIAALCFLVPLYLGFKKISELSSPQTVAACMGKALLKTMKECGIIQSSQTGIVTNSFNDGKVIYCALSGASVHDKNAFSSAMSELLSPFTQPRYIITPEHRENQKKSPCYACPSILSDNKNKAECLIKNLRPVLGNIRAVYTRNDNGRKQLMSCIKSANINQIGSDVKVKKIVNPGWKKK